MTESTIGIQATLFDYFKDTEYFSVQDAEEHVLEHQKRDVNRESIRARIYEGIGDILPTSKEGGFLVH